MNSDGLSRMELLRLIFFVCFIISSLPLFLKANSPPCNYPAIYNFGDSNSDTGGGGGAAAFYPPPPPSGQTYFHRSVRRASDGRLIIDFIAESLGLPYPSPYLDSVGSDYRHGANFATGGATILRPNESWFVNGVSPFCLEIQVQQFTQFKDKISFYKDKKGCFRQRLPRPQDLPLSLFILDIGQNDVASGIRNLNLEQQKANVPNMVTQFTIQLKNLYERGARRFWIHGTGPIGCLPVTVVKVKDPVAGYLDEHGCVSSQNEIAVEYNKQVKVEIFKLRSQLSGAVIIYVDMYKAKHDLIIDAKNQGFKEAFSICCGEHEIGYDVWCGNRGNVNGSEVFSGSCSDPSRVISWDGVHYTEAANNWIATRIIKGSYSDPPVPISAACRA